MKKITFLLEVLILFCLNAVSQNLILNPGFETGSVPTDTGQISNANYWQSYIGYDTNNSQTYVPANLFDVNSTTTGSFYDPVHNLFSHIIVGIPYNYLTCWAEYYPNTISSIEPRNSGNTRFAGLESYLTPGSFQQGPFSPMNRAIEGELDPNQLPLEKGKCYNIGFWAAAASFITPEWDYYGYGPYNNDIIDVSLIDDSGHEKEIVVNNFTGTGDSSLFNRNAINTYGFITMLPCTPYQTPYGIWNFYEAIFCMDSTDYPDDYDQIVFKLNRIQNYEYDVPDVFID